MEENNYRAIIKPYGDEEKEKNLVKILAQTYGGCGLFPLENQTYVVQTSQPILPECMKSLQELGITLEKYVPGFYARCSINSGKVVESSKQFLVTKSKKSAEKF